MKKLLLSLILLCPFMLNASSIDITTWGTGESKVTHVENMYFVRFEYSDIPDQQQPMLPAHYRKIVLYYENNDQKVMDVISIANALDKNEVKELLNMFHEGDRTAIIGDVKAYL